MALRRFLTVLSISVLGNEENKWFIQGLSGFWMEKFLAAIRHIIARCVKKPN